MGTVYILWSRESSTHKIGYTQAQDAANRLIGIQVGHPFPLQIVRQWTVSNPRKLEERLHRHFAELRTQGEWFHLADEDLIVADKIVEEFDDTGRERTTHGQRVGRTSEVALYTRGRSGYHRADPRRIYDTDSTFVLRYVGGNMKRVWETLPKGTDFAGAKRLALEKEVFLASPKARFPDTTARRVTAKAPAPPVDNRVRIISAVDAYIDQLWAENNHVAKTVRVKKQELGRFAEFCRVHRKKEHIADLIRADLLSYRDWMFGEGYKVWTVTGDLTGICTMLKKNPLVSVTGLLRTEDWPDIAPSEPAPFTEAEIKAMLSVSTEDEALLLRFMLGSGCRNQEAAHLQWGDIDFVNKTVWIHAKPNYNWKPKTAAGTRRIPLSDSLIAALNAKKGAKDALVFPAKCGKVNKHLLRTIQSVAERAGVEGAYLHRCRDTWASAMLRQPGVDLLTLRVWIGHEGLDVLRLYAQTLKAKDLTARNAANAVDYASSAAA